MSIKPLRDALLISAFFFVSTAGLVYVAFASTSSHSEDVTGMIMAGMLVISVVLFFTVLSIKRGQQALFSTNQALQVGLEKLEQEKRHFDGVKSGHQAELDHFYSCASVFSENATKEIGVTRSSLVDLSHYSEAMQSSLRELNAKTSHYRNELADASEKVVDALKMADNMMEVNNKVNAALIQIPKITAQINLVALNATIEASRAGDVGKGFAVVASEVKKLAMETFDVTKNITEFLGEGNVAAEQANELVSNMVNVMHDAKSMIEGTVSTIDEHVDSLDHMRGAIDVLSRNVEDMERDISIFHSSIPRLAKR